MSAWACPRKQSLWVHRTYWTMQNDQNIRINPVHILLLTRVCMVACTFACTVMLNVWQEEVCGSELLLSLMWRFLVVLDSGCTQRTFIVCMYLHLQRDVDSVRSIRARELRILLVVADEIFPYPGVSYFSMFSCSKILLASVASYKYIHPVGDSQHSGDSREAESVSTTPLRCTFTLLRTDGHGVEAVKLVTYNCISNFFARLNAHQKEGAKQAVCGNKFMSKYCECMACIEVCAYFIWHACLHSCMHFCMHSYLKECARRNCFFRWCEGFWLW